MSDPVAPADLIEIDVPVAIPSPTQCSECVSRVIRTVDAIEGVGSVDVDPATSRLHATIDVSRTAEDELREEIERAGFEAVESVGHASWRLEGLDCPDCARTVAISVSRLDGVLAADLNFASALLSVEYDHEMDPRPQVDSMMTKMGYASTLLGDTGERPLAEFRLTGLDCPDCARQLGERISKMPGVAEAGVDFATARMRVGYDPHTISADALREAIRAAGYEVETESGTTSEERLGWLQERRHEIGVAISAAAIATAIIVDVLGGPAPIGIALYALAIVMGGILVARRAWASVQMRVLDMNVLMTIAVIGAVLIGEWREGAMVVFLFAIGGLLESRSLARTRRSIRDLMDMAPETGRVRRDGQLVELSPTDMQLGDTLVVKPGERIALDGLVTEGLSAVDESPITGESVPADKAPGDEVFAGSLNTSGLIEVQVTSLAAETTLARVIYLVEEAQSQRAPSQQLVDRFTRYYTPAVVVLAALVALLPPLIGLTTGLETGTFSEWFYRALVLLVVSCPCALVISTPVAIVSAITRATREGILVKGGSFLEIAPRIQTVAFDKTGTLTQGMPEVADIEAFAAGSVEDVLERAASLEAGSSHPLAQAVARAAEGVELASVTDLQEQAGSGVTGVVDGTSWSVGSPRMARDDGAMDEQAEESVARMEADARTVLVVWAAADDAARQVYGMIGISDQIRDGAARAVDELSRVGIGRTVMLTGDNERTAAAVAHAVGVDEYKARLLPQDKVAAVREFKSEGAVAMVGDGINDAPALAASDLGIAMGAAGSDTAIETADVALMSDDLSALARFFDLGHRTVANIRQNVVFSVAIKLIVLVAAIAGYAPLWLAVFADTGVALLVILNGLRLLRPMPRV